MGFLKGKVAIITGGGRVVLSDGKSCGSIGYGIAIAYAKEGCDLVVTGRNLQKLEDAREELEGLYGIKSCLSGPMSPPAATMRRWSAGSLMRPSGPLAALTCLSPTPRPPPRG